jgi:hypothetical protein
MNVGSPPITHCPVCRYDLTGLPAEHRCPECGFRYDETTYVWRMSVIPRWVLVLVAVLVFFILLGRLVPPLMSRYALNYREASVVAALLSAIVLLVGAYALRGFVAVGREGLTYRFPLRPAQSVRWSDIRIADDGRTIYRVCNGRDKALTLPTIGLPWKRRWALHAEIARHREEAVGH